MNEHKKMLPCKSDLGEVKEEEYEVIKEDYNSSPKCGTRERVVHKLTRNVSFSPLEISTYPYFKYCVTQMKEEHKNDNSINNGSLSDLKINNKELQHKKENIGFMSEANEAQKSININIIKEKSNKKSNVIYSKKTNKNKQIHRKKENYNIQYIRFRNFMNSDKLSKKIISLKLKLNVNSEKEEKKSMEKSNYIYTTTYNTSFNKNTEKPIPTQNDNDEETPQNLCSTKISNNTENIDKEKEKEHTVKINSILNIHTLNFKNDKEKRFCPKQLEQKPSPGVRSTNNIKNIKKPKKILEVGKKQKGIIVRQHSFIPINKIKKVKINTEEKDKNDKKRYSLITKDGNKKDNKKIYFNMLINNENNKKILTKTKHSRHKKMKSLGYKNNKSIKLEKYNKKYDQENDVCATPKRRMNYAYKLRMDDSFKDSESNKIPSIPNSSKSKRKVSIFDNEIKKRKRLFGEEKKDNPKKKSIFCNPKDREKEKDKFPIFKEVTKDKIIVIKDKGKEKEKEKKFKRKRSKKLRAKDGKEEKDKKAKKETTSNSKPNKRPLRKDKSFTIISKLNKNLINEEFNINEKSLQSSEPNHNKDENDNENAKNNISNNMNNIIKVQSSSDVRRNSAGDHFRENKEKITAYTNKQTIDNINEYTRTCLEIIPDILELGEKMPRCKTKINFNFSKDKKIALFDLDETIVHCIGEINMNNIESLSRQSDVKIKVHLPGGKREVTIGINIRPHWEEALNKIKNKYHIVAFTASHESYADSVLNYLDPNNQYFEYRLYRAHCVLCSMDEAKFYVKDLKILEDNYNLKDVVIIDNSVLSFAYHLDNGIPISPYYDSKIDTELLDIADFLVKYGDENDIRDKLKEVYKLNQYLEILKNYSSSETSEISIIEEEKNIDEDNDKYILNKNKTNLQLNLPIKALEDDNNKEKIEKKIDYTSKNIYQPDLKLKEIKNIFIDSNSEDSGKENNINHSPQSEEKENYLKYINKNVKEKNKDEMKKKEKKKTMKFDINFKKVWEDKKKELKNDK